MDRNTGFSLTQAPSVSAPRSTFDGLSHSLKTTWNVGDIIPIFCEEVLPGDTWDLSTSKVIRMQTLISPIMDNLYTDIYYFFVPLRLIWEHFEPFITGSVDDNSPWIPVPDYSVPAMLPDVDGFTSGSLADYFGLPLGIGNAADAEEKFKVVALPFRAYGKIVNDWFISDALTQPYYWSTGDADVIFKPDSDVADEVNKIYYGCRPVKACKYPDAYTMALPSPQRGEDVQVPVAQDNVIPVHTTKYPNSYFGGDYMTSGDKPAWFSNYVDTLDSSYPVYWDFPQNSLYVGKDNYPPKPFVLYGGDAQIEGVPSGEYKWINSYDSNNSDMPFVNLRFDAQGGEQYYVQQPLEKYTTWRSLAPINLVADLNPVYTTINQLRLAFQIQKLYERDARSGSRYVELLRGHFQVQSPDARLQRSEYLGGSRFPLHIHQVTQTSSTSSDSALGDTGAMSVTADTNHDFQKSFTEHGLILGLAVTRYSHTYQEKLDKSWSRFNRFDYYWPTLANLGEMPLYQREVCATASNVTDGSVFGYQEAWFEYRYRQNMVTSEMRSSHATSLDFWHLADDYDTAPSLSDEWLREDQKNLDRCLAVTSSVANQIFGDFYFDCKVTRAMPVHSIPGFIDHF